MKSALAPKGPCHLLQQCPNSLFQNILRASRLYARICEQNLSARVRNLHKTDILSKSIPKKIMGYPITGWLLGANSPVDSGRVVSTISICGASRKRLRILKYMHRNPVVRGLVASPEGWLWSSYRSYAYGEAGLVRINDWTWWEGKIRRRAGRGLERCRRKAPLLAKNARNGAPDYLLAA